jgi:hypothetical protein
MIPPARTGGRKRETDVLEYSLNRPTNSRHRMRTHFESMQLQV